jgi:hypothetical protein
MSDTVPFTVDPAVGEVIETVGGIVSAVTVTVVCEVTVPLLFVAVSVYVVVVVGDTTFDVVPVTAPTPPLIESVGAGVPVTVHDNVDELPFEIDAGVARNDEITGAVFETVTPTPDEVAVFPEVSVATAVKVCAAFEAAVEFQEIE